MAEEKNTNVSYTSEDAVAEKLNIMQTIHKGLCKFGSWLGFGSKYYKSDKRRKKLFFDIITYTILVAFSFIMIYPFWWMLAASFAGNQDAMLNMAWWPSYTAADNPSLGGFFKNYENVFTIAQRASGTTFWQATGITLVYSLVPVTVGIITSTMAAFAFAKLNFKGRNVMFFYCLAAVMIPGPSLMIAQYCIYASIGWTQGPLTMIIPGCFGAIMTAFFIRQYLYSMPTAIIEAAKIDGAGYWRIFWTFIIPLAMPAITAQFILSFIGCWNNYLGPLFFVQNNAWKPLALLNAQFPDYDATVDLYASRMAISVLALLPVLILFAVFQKWILGSIMLTGSKE